MSGAGPGVVLAADIGGTKTAMALARIGAPARSVLAQTVYPSQSYPGLEGILQEFLRRPEVAPHANAIASACFAVAGPVSGKTGSLTNLGWALHTDSLARAFSFGRVVVINDFAAVGLGIAHLNATELLQLQAGVADPSAARAVIGAGTGLGVALLTRDGARDIVHSSEAGHSDYAPTDEMQDRLLVYLRGKFGRVSYERVVSGPGLLGIYECLCETGARMASPELSEALQAGADLPGIVAEWGLSGRDPLAARALEIFVDSYGAFAGNIALTMLARGGVYISGGIAPKLAAKLTDGRFMKAFTDKGRFAGLLQGLPVHVVMNAEVGLYGALDMAGRAPC